jgi:hypothetical protein
MKRGRPRGSGYADEARIAAVSALMRTGLSRRAAILRTCGPDQLRRIEMKMRITAMTESAQAKLDATLCAHRQDRDAPDGPKVSTNSPSPFLQVLEEVGYYTVDGLTRMVEELRSHGFRMIYVPVDTTS